MSTTLFKDFTFEAATAYHTSRKGINVVACTGIPYGATGNYRGSRSAYGLDYRFAELKAAFKPTYERLDHHYLKIFQVWKTQPAKF